MFKNIIIFLGIVLTLVSCTGKEAKKQESAFIVMKTPSIKFADMGFIYTGKTEMNIEVYASGKPLVDLQINEEDICLSLWRCMDKKQFNKEVLVASYPDELLENIFRQKVIFNGRNLEKIEGGFVQKITKENEYDIDYSVISGKRVFRDRINKILIKVREQ